MVKAPHDVSLKIYILFAIFLVIIGVALSAYNYSLEGAAIAVLGFAPLFYKLDKNLFKGFLIGPLFFAYVFHLLGYAIGPLWQQYIIHRLDPIYAGFVPAQWGGVLGLTTLAITFPLFFKLGQKLFRPQKSNHSMDKPKDNWLGYTIILLFVAIFIILLGFISGVSNRLAGGFVSLPLESLISLFSNVGYVAFFYLGYAAARYRGGWWPLWLIVYILFAIFYFLDGSRGAPIYAAIFSAAGWFWAGVPWRRLIIVGLLGLMIFIPFVGVVELYRDEFADLPSRISFDKRIDGLRRAGNEFATKNTISLAQSTEAFARAMTARTVDRVFLLTPESIPYVGLEGIENIIYAVVPEIIHPGRPVLVDGNELAIRYGAAPSTAKGAYIPTVGDGYRRGGWIGIVLLYTFTSVIYASISAACWERRGQREWMAMFVFIVFQSPGMWSTTLLTNFYFLLWFVPRNFLIFWFLRLIQDFLNIQIPHQSVRSLIITGVQPKTTNFLDKPK